MWLLVSTGSPCHIPLQVTPVPIGWEWVWLMPPTVKRKENDQIGLCGAQTSGNPSNPYLLVSMPSLT